MTWPGSTNAFALGTNVFSGSSPEGEEGFASLEKLGVKTIITVDGAKPRTGLARKYGMRYVHLPHGYDGISTNLQMRLVQAGKALPGPIYVHCHHGKHRGPAAAAVICMGARGWSTEQAEAWLRVAGTSTNYAGLYEVVRGFTQPAVAALQALPPAFPEIASVSGLVEAMVAIDERWEHLKAVQAAGYTAPKDHPDLNPANEAVILWELYREAGRLPAAAEHGDQFLALLKKAESEAREAESRLRRFESDQSHDLRASIDSAFSAMGKSCASCHKRYRNTREL